LLTVAAAPSLVNDYRQIILNASTGNQFFRLNWTNGLPLSPRPAVAMP